MARTKQTARKRPAENIQAPVKVVRHREDLPPGVRELMLKLFHKDYTSKPHRPRFGLAKCNTTSPSTPTDDGSFFLLVWEITHDVVSPFLAPHDILSLLRTCNGVWTSWTPRQRRRAIFRSLFSYLRISEEAAQSVHNTVRGGWRAFAPLMVQMSAHFSRAYGHLEPDTAHRAFAAEQACFRREFGSLAGYEYFKEFACLYDDHNEHATASIDPPSLDYLKSVPSRSVCWGDLGPCVTAYSNDGMKDWLERNRRWMVEHSAELKDAQRHYRQRLESGLHPPIWICFDIGSEPVEWALGIGPNREQFVFNVSSYYELGAGRPTERDYLCCECPDAHLLDGGFVEFLAGFPCAYEQMHEPTPTLGIAIWCMRHGLQPFATIDFIEWKALIEAECSHEDDKAKAKFLTEALTSPLFGPANFEEYTY